jgi:selenocysteine lyase/cysteine desulfurase
MKTRRDFLAGVSSIGVAAAAFRGDAIARAAGAGRDAAQTPPPELAQNEDYWSQIQRCFDVDRSRVNFNNGGVCPCPSHVLDQMIRDLRFTNEMPAHHMWSVLEPRVETVRRNLAADFGCDPEELAVTRNASEALEIAILGLDLKKGDEVIVTDQNYGRMLTTWDQRVRREGIVLKTVKFPAPLDNPQTFVDRISEAITPQTKAIEFPHIVNITGQILPVREVMKIARPKGIEVIIDGAHSYAHFPFTRDELDCDMFGTSLHKWLLAPIGTGFLYVRKDKIKKVWPLMAAGEGQSENIRKYEEIGTHPAANHNAIAASLAFHQGIGVERKAARLRYLRNRWLKPLMAAHPQVKVAAPIDDDSASCGITVVNINDLEPGKLGEHLMDKYGILVVGIGGPAFKGIRVTPNVYATLSEIDRFGEILMQVADKGIPEKKVGRGGRSGRGGAERKKA